MLPEIEKLVSICRRTIGRPCRRVEAIAASAEEVGSVKLQIQEPYKCDPHQKRQTEIRAVRDKGTKLHPLLPATRDEAMLLADTFSKWQALKAVPLLHTPMGSVDVIKDSMGGENATTSGLGGQHSLWIHSMTVLLNSCTILQSA